MMNKPRTKDSTPRKLRELNTVSVGKKENLEISTGGGLIFGNDNVGFRSSFTYTPTDAGRLKAGAK